MKVVTLEESATLPRAYVASRNGLMKATKYGGTGKPVQFRTVRPISLASSLPEIKQDLMLDRFDPLPKELIERVIAVFRAGYDAMKTEMAVILCWRDGRYSLTRPTFQLTSSAHVRHLYSGADKIGVFHSHPTFAGHPSGVDDANEVSVPGIYAVFGRVMDASPDIFLSVTADGMRQRIALPDYGPLTIPQISEEERAWWLEFARPTEWLNNQTGFSIMDTDGKTPIWWAETEEKAKFLAGELIVKKTEPVRLVYTPPSGYWDDWETYDRWAPVKISEPAKEPKKKKRKRRMMTERKKMGFVMVYPGCAHDMRKLGHDIVDILDGAQALELLEGLIEACEEPEEDSSSSDVAALDMPWPSQ
jgi:hypothetical protein